MVAQETMEEKRQRAKRLVETLLQEYPGAPLALHYSSALELLIAVILSAQCTDERVNRVTADLFGKYRTAQDFATVGLEVLEQDIRSTGFYRNKAKSIVNCCRDLVERFGGEVPRSMDELVSLPGVGRKTAAMVLGNAYGVNQGIAVDTHVKRLAQRTGLSMAKTPEKIEKELMELIPRDEWTRASNAMILHGRRVCTARKPKCSGCVLSPHCLFEAKT